MLKICVSYTCSVKLKIQKHCFWSGLRRLVDVKHKNLLTRELKRRRLIILFFAFGKIKHRPVKTHLYLQFTTGSGGGSIAPAVYVIHRNREKEVHMNYGGAHGGGSEKDSQGNILSRTNRRNTLRANWARSNSRFHGCTTATHKHLKRACACLKQGSKTLHQIILQPCL